MNKRILLFGKNGQLGSELRRLLSRHDDVMALGREDVDLGDEAALREAMSFLPHVDLIVNAAGYTSVDLAENDERTATAVNVFAPEFLAREAKRRGVPLIHFSSDYIFDGVGRTSPYTESERPNPLSVYGKTKLGGEIAIRETGAKSLIFRTSGLYGGERNFVANMLRLAEKGHVPKVVDDQIVSPNHVTDVAAAVRSIIGRIFSGEAVPWGTCHLSGGGATTWHGFACEIFRLYENMTERKTTMPVPITTREYGTPAERPAYSVLDPGRLETVFGIRLPHWKTQLRDYMEKEGNITKPGEPGCIP